MSFDVTIVIPSYNRHKQLGRLLNYYSTSNLPIIVGDSTSYPFSDAKKYKNVQYYHFPNIPYAHKLPLIYNKVKTKYVLFCADDDFVVPKAIKECVKFLDKNPNYSAAHGHYVFFETGTSLFLGNKISSQLNNSDKISVYPFYLYAVDTDINADTPTERVKQVLTGYMQLLYAVIKTSVVKEIFNNLRKNPQIKNDTLVELYQAIMICINGKAKTLPILYCAREVTANSARTRIPPLEVIITQDKYKKEYNHWFNMIVKYLIKKRVSSSEAKATLSDSINIFLKGLIITIPFINIHIYTDLVKRFIIVSTFGLSKKLRDLIKKPKDHVNLTKHAYSKPEARKEFERIKLYIGKYNIN